MESHHAEGQTHMAGFWRIMGFDGLIIHEQAPESSERPHTGNIQFS